MRHSKFTKTTMGSAGNECREAFEALGCTISDPLPAIRNSALDIPWLENQFEVECDMLGIKTLEPLSACKMIDGEPNPFAVQISYLDLGQNDIESIAGIEWFIGLKSLFLGHNLIRDLEPLAELLSRQYTNCDKYYQAYSDPEGEADISSLDNAILEELELGNNQIGNIQSLSEALLMKYLSLENNAIEDISVLAESDTLTILNLENNLVHDASFLFGPHGTSSLDLEVINLLNNPFQLSDQNITAVTNILEFCVDTPNSIASQVDELPDVVSQIVGGYGLRTGALFLSRFYPVEWRDIKDTLHCSTFPN